MAISWIAALKLVPWGDVIEAAPHVLKAAKGLLRRSDGDSKAEPKPVSPTPQVDLSRDDAAAQALEVLCQKEFPVLPFSEILLLPFFSPCIFYK